MSGGASSKPMTIAALVLALIALALSSYLSVQSLTGGAVAGCGGDSGCGEVLASAWSRLGPVPVALLGALTHLAVIVGLVLRIRSNGQSRLGDGLLLAGAAAMPMAAFWFTHVQLNEIDALCPYCIADHAAGFVLSVLLLVIVLGRSAVKPALPIVLGVVAAGAMIAVQVAFPNEPGPADADNLFVNEDGDTDINGKRFVSMFGGKLQFNLEDRPYLGSADAGQVVAMVFDYGCKHCRKTHALIDSLIKQDPSRFVFVPLPITIDDATTDSQGKPLNPYLDDISPMFDDSYERAKLSLAVGAIDRDKWVAFDRWLFALDEPDAFPRSAADARAKAHALVGKQALDDQLTGKALKQHEQAIAEHIGLLGLLPVNKRIIPLTTTPGAPSHLTGRFTEPKPLLQLLGQARTHLQANH